ncbi:MAG: hypothetical protein ACKPKO_58050, partial [Candidatus Fonsibacter sp.]
QSAGPARAALQFDVPANMDIDLPRNTLKRLNTGEVEFDLPIPLQIIDAEQRENHRAIRTSSAPVHVIHGLAGYGKSMMLQCLVAMDATRHSRLSAADRGAEAIWLTLQALRHEFLKELLHNTTLRSGSRYARQ